MTHIPTVTPTALLSLRLDEHRVLPIAAAIDVVLAADTVPHGPQAVPLDV